MHLPGVIAAPPGHPDPRVLPSHVQPENRLMLTVGLPARASRSSSEPTRGHCSPRPQRISGCDRRRTFTHAAQAVASRSGPQTVVGACLHRDRGLLHAEHVSKIPAHPLNVRSQTSRLLGKEGLTVGLCGDVELDRKLRCGGAVSDQPVGAIRCPRARPAPLGAPAPRRVDSPPKRKPRAGSHLIRTG